MKQTLIFSFIFIFINSIWGQFIFNTDYTPVSRFDLVKINNDEKVLINIHDNWTYNMDARQYFYYSDSIGGIMKSYPSFGTNDSMHSYESLMFHVYPEYIRIRNNNFKLSLFDANDSIIIAEDGRINKILASETIQNGTFYYPDSNTIIIADKLKNYESGKINGEDFIRFTRYRLDNHQNILVHEYGEIAKTDFSLSDSTKVAMLANEQFIYNKHEQIVEIRINHLMAKNPLQSIQKFYYKKGRPHKSTFYDFRRGRITFWFDYYYSKITEPDRLFFIKSKRKHKNINTEE